MENDVGSYSQLATSPFPRTQKSLKAISKHMKDTWNSQHVFTLHESCIWLTLSVTIITN